MSSLLYEMYPLATESISCVTASPSIKLGSRRIHDGNEYVYIYNGGGSDIPAKYGCTFSETVGTSGYTVTVSSLSQINPLAGVVVHNTLTTATYGWVLVRGIAPVKNSSTTEIGMAERATLGVDGKFIRASDTTDWGKCGAQVFSLSSFAADATGIVAINGIL